MLKVHYITFWREHPILKTEHIQTNKK